MNDRAIGPADTVELTVPALQLMSSGAMAELADAEDLKSSGGDTLWVRFPPAPHSAAARYNGGVFNE